VLVERALSACARFSDHLDATGGEVSPGPRTSKREKYKVAAEEKKAKLRRTQTDDQVLAVLDAKIRRNPEARRWCQPVGYGGGCFGEKQFIGAGAGPRPRRASSRGRVARASPARVEPRKDGARVPGARRG